MPARPVFERERERESDDFCVSCLPIKGELVNQIEYNVDHASAYTEHAVRVVTKAKELKVSNWRVSRFPMWILCSWRNVVSILDVQSTMLHIPELQAMCYGYMCGISVCR